MISLSAKIEMLKSFYIPLIEAFLTGDLTVSKFQKIYFDKRLEDQTISPKREIFDVLQAIFEDMDAYEEDPDPSEWPTEIGEDELRRCCTENLAKLKAFVQEYEAQS